MRIIAKLCGAHEVSAIEIADGLITAVEPADRLSVEERQAALGAPDMMVAPALLDIQVNGFYGFNLNSPETGPEVTMVLSERRGGYRTLRVRSLASEEEYVVEQPEEVKHLRY